MDFWHEVEGFPNYVINPDGELKSVASGQLKNSRINNYGDRIVDLYRDGRQHTRKVALLVAQAYLEPPPTEAYNSVIQHDGDRGNCAVGNLSWRPRWFVVLYNQMFKERAKDVSVIHHPSEEIFGTLREACIKFGLVEKNAYVNILNGDPIFPLKGTLEIL
ncbi:HNH endonuclease [Gordonia phage Conley]|nr:HNH endonuclease [Gordonia phage Conley]